MLNTKIGYVKIPKVKRMFDISVSIFLFFISLPFLIILFLWIIIEQIIFLSSRGSLFYCEKRISGGKEFNFCKFRIFKKAILEKLKKKTNCIHTKPLEQNKKNMTYCGRILKQIYMDEWPQLFNVLKGEMSLVGPRPTNLVNSRLAREAGDFTRERILCGITGPYQSEKGSGANQRELDEEYINFIKNNPGWKIIFLDLKILFKTVRIIFKAKGI